MSRRRQRCLTDFVSSATATSSSRESEDEGTTTCLSSELNNDEESSESETGDTDGLPMPKRSKSSGSGHTGKHRKSGFDPGWTREFKWLEKVETAGRLGMYCKLCKKHGKVPRNGKGGWCTKPCFTLRKDKIVRHAESRMHRDAAMVEAEHSAGGIRQAFQDAVT